VHRAAIGFDVLLGRVEPGLRVVDAAQDRRAAEQARDQAVAVARVGIVLGIVAGETDRDAVGRLELERAAGGPDVLVVILEALDVEIVAEAAAAEPGDRGADLDARST
jgi:hypothetical protein